MKRYLIKETVTATENNKNFKGEVKIYYIGKDGSYLFGSIENRTGFIKYHGYSTKAAAASAMKRVKQNRDWFEHEFNTGTHKFELIEIEITV